MKYAIRILSLTVVVFSFLFVFSSNSFADCTKGNMCVGKITTLGTAKDGNAYFKMTGDKRNLSCAISTSGHMRLNKNFVMYALSYNLLHDSLLTDRTVIIHLEPGYGDICEAVAVELLKSK